MPFEEDSSGFTVSMETSAVKALFDSNYRALVYFAYKITGDKSEAEDIVQDAFVSYWNHRDEVSPDTRAIRSYLYAMVRNAGLNWLRHRQVVHNYEQRHADEPAEEMGQALIEAEVMAAIHLAIASLPPVCQTIIRLGHLEGRKNNEIADALGISVNSVKTHKQRGLQLLRRRLSPELFALLLLLACCC